ncbi:hypothetical protein N8787_01040 [Opitutaceae bacterium]|nr:hypothetical protein [Opitutaceae bacterium]
MPRLPKAFQLAEEMGTMLGRGRLLLKEMQPKSEGKIKPPVI